MGPMHLSLDFSPTFTPAMERLRRRCFLGEDATRTSSDEFDAASGHVVISCAGDPIAQIRVTLDPPFAVVTWSGGRAEVPSGAEVAELSRANVAPEFRGLGLSRVVFRAALMRLATAGKRVVVGAEEVSLLAAPMYRRLGYRPVGPLVTFREPIGLEIQVQPVTIPDVLDRVIGWRDEQLAEISRLVDAELVLTTSEGLRELVSSG